ncbi:MAG TPA: ribosomal-processing cysteine protease Prp [Candidatus Baltobacteraceae bacterium]|nr:ribosomal-processing cysteine protease Prp [Candidatus Baltobacteraceae bacterium]
MTFRRDSRNRLSSVSSTGHVDIPETSSDEYSLVCASISAILQAARLGLEAYAGVPLEVRQGSGELVMRWPPQFRQDERTQAIVETAFLATRQIAAQYPRHVRLVEETQA